MNRKEFLQSCAAVCLLPTSLLLQGCGSAHSVQGSIVGSDLVIPLSVFATEAKDGTSYKNYLVVHHESLRQPVCVYRLGEKEYSALLMRCSHKGAELEAGEQGLSCPVHGSEFSKQGVALNKPASSNLRLFPTRIENAELKISLK